MSLFLAYALELCWIIMKGKQKLEERKIVTYYYYLAILGLGLYASMVIFVWRQHVSGRPWSDMLCIGFYLYMFGEMVISLSGVPVEKIKQEERLKKERKSLRAEQENRDEKERFETEWRERGECSEIDPNGIYCFEKILQKEISQGSQETYERNRAGIFCKYRSSCDNMFDFRG